MITITTTKLLAGFVAVSVQHLWVMRGATLTGRVSLMWKKAMQESRLLMPALSPAADLSYDGEAAGSEALMAYTDDTQESTTGFFPGPFDLKHRDSVTVLDVGKTTNRAIPSFHRRGGWLDVVIGMSWVRASRSWKVEAIISESWKRQFCGRDCRFVSFQKGWCFCIGTIGGGLWKVSKNLVIITVILCIVSCYLQYVII